MKRIQSPLDENTLNALKAGEKVRLSGTILTGRDAAHKRMYAALQAGEKLPIAIEGQTIYYVGPAPAKPGQVIGPAGPTTSGRMDASTPALLNQGLKAMIGKGRRDKNVVESMKANGAVYLAAVGGTAAIMAKSIQSVEVIAYEDLGTEAIRKMVVKDMPLIVAVDANGVDFYDLGPALYKEETADGSMAE